MPTRAEFAASIKAKYPEYERVDDNTLVDKMLEKYPEYQDRVTPEISNGPVPAGHGMGDLKAAESPDANPQVDKSNFFPSAMQEYQSRFAKPAGSVGQSLKDFGAVGAAAAGDIGSLLQRGAAAAFTDQQMSDPGAHALKAQTDAAVQNAQAGLDAHPELKNYIPPGGFGGMPMMMPTPAMAPGLTEVGGRIIDDPASYLGGLDHVLGAAPKAVEGLGKGAGFLNKQAGRMASELSGVPEEALRAYGDPIQQAKMAANFGKEKEIGSDLLHQVDNPDKFLPEKQVVDAALQKMGPISVEDAAKKLEASKVPETGRTFDYERAANKKIQGYADDLRGAPGTDPNVPAPEYRDLRKRLDVLIDHDTEEGKRVNAALMGGRATMKEALIQKALESGDPGYVEAMKSWSGKMDKLDQLKSLLGKNATTRDRRVESFVSNLFGKNSAYKQQLLSDLDEVFKTDLVGRAKSADMAASLGEDGKPALAPRHMTGAALKAGLLAHLVPVAGTVAAIGTASPRIAATLTLPALTKLEEGLKAAGIAMTPKAANAMQALKRATTDAQRARLASILAAELETQMPANAIPFRQKVAEDDSIPGPMVRR